MGRKTEDGKRITKKIKDKEKKKKFGNKSSKGSRELLEESVHYSSMATAAYSAIEKGWEFMSANVIQGSGSVTHYYYMKRNKK